MNKSESSSSFLSLEGKQFVFVRPSRSWWCRLWWCGGVSGASWVFWSWHSTQNTLQKGPEGPVTCVCWVAPLRLYCSYVVHGRSTSGGLCSGDWKLIQLDGLLWSQSCTAFFAMCNINLITNLFWRWDIKSTYWYCFKVMFVKVVCPLTKINSSWDDSGIKFQIKLPRN